MIRRLHLIILSLCTCICIGAGTAGAWYPNTAQVELGTTTWCVYCPQAYQGIEVNKDHFGPHEFTAIRYYDSSGGGGLSTPETNARNDYYSINSYPTAYFNGMTRIVGGGDEVEAGTTYQAAIENLLDDPSYFKLTINSFDLTAPEGSIDLDLEIMEDVPDISQIFVRIALTEDDITYAPHEHMDVTRDMLEDQAITVNTTGQVQNIALTFPIDAGWVEEHLKLVAFVQDDADKKVWASIDTRPTPDYAFRYYALGERQTVGPIYANHAYDWFEIFNVGSMADSVFVEVTAQGTEGWINVLCTEEFCIGPSVESYLEPGESLKLQLETISLSSGYNQIAVEIRMKNLDATYNRTLNYTYITDDVDVVVIDDDGAEEYEDYFTGALDYLGRDYGVWDRGASAADASVLANFEAVVWNVGWSFPTLDEADRAALSTYLDNGGRLFVTGQDIGWELNDIGGEAAQFYQDYLHAIFVNDDTNDYGLEGIENDPISHQLDLTIIGGDGASNQDYPSDIDPADGSASVIWKYDDNRNGAIKADDGNHRVVYFAFGYEAIDNAYDRAIVMHRVLNWLIMGTTDVAEDAPAYRLQLAGYPNPVQTAGQIRFVMPSAGQASLKIYGPDGRVARVLTEGLFEAGPHTLEWDGTDAAGVRLPAGIYYYRLDTGDQAVTRKAVLMK